MTIDEPNYDRMRDDLMRKARRIGVLGGENDGPPPKVGQIHPVPKSFVRTHRDGTLAAFPKQDGPSCSNLRLEPPQ